MLQAQHIVLLYSPTQPRIISCMIHFLRGLCLGMVSSFSFPVAPLYRYPHYHSGEALRGDWLKIGKDVEAALTEGQGYEQ